MMCLPPATACCQTWIIVPWWKAWINEWKSLRHWSRRVCARPSRTPRRTAPRKTTTLGKYLSMISDCCLHAVQFVLHLRVKMKILLSFIRLKSTFLSKGPKMRISNRLWNMPPRSRCCPPQRRRKWAPSSQPTLTSTPGKWLPSIAVSGILFKESLKDTCSKISYFC